MSRAAFLRFTFEGEVLAGTHSVNAALDINGHTVCFREMFLCFAQGDGRGGLALIGCDAV